MLPSEVSKYALVHCVRGLQYRSLAVTRYFVQEDLVIEHTRPRGISVGTAFVHDTA